MYRKLFESKSTYQCRSLWILVKCQISLDQMFANNSNSNNIKNQLNSMDFVLYKCNFFSVSKKT